MSDSLSPSDRAKRAAAEAALAFVEPGMKLGLGTGSTARWFVDLLAARVAAGGLAVDACVPTSSRTRDQAAALGLPLATLDEVGSLDLTVDGADEFDPSLRLIKGGGGALLQEKIVAAASARMIVIADRSKEVGSLGAFPLPVELVRFGARATTRAIARALAGTDVAGREIRLREAPLGTPFITDEGHYIADLRLGRIGDPEGLNTALNLIPGVVETGIFAGLATAVVVGEEDGSARILGDPRRGRAA